VNGYSALMADEETTDPLVSLSERRRHEREAVDEAGGGQSEGFELAEQELIEHTSHGDGHSPAKISRDAFGEGDSEQPPEDEYGEADEEHLTD
jgi:hypothetical protein